MHGGVWQAKKTDETLLTYTISEPEQIRQRGLSASTFVSQPFWLEMQKFLRDQVEARVKALRDAREAEPRVKANLVDRWLLTEELVARIERFPQAAIEAGRESGE